MSTFIDALDTVALPLLEISKIKIKMDNTDNEIIIDTSANKINNKELHKQLSKYNIRKCLIASDMCWDICNGLYYKEHAGFNIIRLETNKNINEYTGKITFEIHNDNIDICNLVHMIKLSYERTDEESFVRVGISNGMLLFDKYTYHFKRIALGINNGIVSYSENYEQDGFNILIA